MKSEIKITATIVLYNEEVNELSKTIDSFLNIPISKKLFLVDNSPTDKLRALVNHPDVEYVFNGKNIGFGAGHNIVIDKIKNFSKYHLILNPDVSFKPSVISSLIKAIEKEEELAMIAPKVIFPNGEHQYSCRKYPTVLEMISRKMGIFKKYVQGREYRNGDLTKPFYPNFIHGCFQLFKTEYFVKIHGFDERYFLYMEDVDICKKIDTIGKKKMYYPNEEVVHVLKKGSSKSIQLFIHHFLSSSKYFFKWGFKK